MNHAARFGNTLTITNDDMELRVKLMDEFDDYIKISVTTDDMMMVVFEDESALMSFKGEIYVAENHEQGADLFSYLVHKNPVEGAELLKEMSNQMQEAVCEMHELVREVGD